MSHESTSGEAVPADPSHGGPFDVGVLRARLPEHHAADGTTRPLRLVLWYPTGDDGDLDPALKGRIDARASGAGPFPVVGFSHGYLGMPEQSTFLMAHLASHGFVVAAARHVDGKQTRDGSFLNRPGEVRAAVDFAIEQSALDDSLLSGAVDATRLGVMGHSFGALTTLALLAQQDNRFTAGIAMAPGIRAGDVVDVRDDLPKITAPTMFMMGQQDVLALYPDLTAGYAALQTDERYALVFPEANHFAFTDLHVTEGAGVSALDHAQGHQLISTYATAFMQVFVAGQTGFERHLRQGQDIADGAAHLTRGPLLDRDG